MTKEEFLGEAKKIIEARKGDPEALHIELDHLMVSFINCPEFTELLDSQSLWYA